MGDFENLIFPDPEDLVYDEIWGIRNSSFDIFDQLSFTYVKALRDAVRELKYSKFSPLKYLFESLNSEVKKVDLEKIGKNVEDLNNNITNLENIQKFTKDIQKTINSSVGLSYSPTIEIKSEIPGELQSLLKSLSLWVGDPNDPHLGSLEDLSLGGANLVYLSIKLLEYERKQKKNHITHFLLIEEPEAHLHTHIQKSLFLNLHSDIAQIFVTTHSTNLSSASKIDSMNVLSCNKKFSEVFWPSNKLSQSQSKKVERYLDAVRSNLLFAKGVILVEGDAEDIIIPAAVKKCLGLSLDELGISVINIGSTGFENVAILFNKERIRRFCAIVTDSDNSIVDLSKLNGSLSERDRKFYKSQQRSEKSGKARIVKLNELIKNNKWLSYFLSNNTFEVDVISIPGNEKYYLKLSGIYKNKTKVEQELNSIEKSIYGRRALRLANTYGKGWFAVELAEQIDPDFEIPDYILRAIVFAGRNSINHKIIEKSLNYICNYVSENKILDEIKKHPEWDVSQKMGHYSRAYSDDNLMRFFNIWNEYAAQ